MPDVSHKQDGFIESIVGLADLTNQASRVRGSLFALVATWLGVRSRQVRNDFSLVSVDAQGFRTFDFEGVTYPIAARAPSDTFIAPGVNIYFGDDISLERKVKPQIYSLPIALHVLVPWTEQPNIGENLAIRLSALVDQAFEGLAGKLPVLDLTQSPPALVTGRFVSWARSSRGVWREAGDPSTDVFTNRILSLEVFYTR